MASQCHKCQVVFPTNSKEVISCVVCGNYFHPTCTRIGTLVKFGKMGAKKGNWKCDACVPGETSISGSSSTVSTEEEPRNSEILETLRQLQLQMTRQLDERFAGMQIEFTAIKETLSSVKESVVLLTQENQVLREKCGSLEKQNSDLKDEVDVLREEVRDLQQYSRRDNLEIVGVPLTPGENVYGVMEKIAEAIGVDYKKEEISVAHRMSRTKKQDHPAIIAKFTTRTAKMEWWAAAKKRKIGASDLHSSLPNTPVYINDHLTAHNKAVLGRARRLVREKRLAFAWVNNCRVLVRVSADSQARHVRAIEDLDSMLQSSGR